MRFWGLTSYRLRTMTKDPLTMLNEQMYPKSGVRDPAMTERVFVKPHLSFRPGHAAGNLVGPCQCQHAPLAPFLRPGVGQCLCLPADGGPMFNGREHRLSALSKQKLSPRWVVPSSQNLRQPWMKTRSLPNARKEVLEYIRTRTTEERRKQRKIEAEERLSRRVFSRRRK